MQMSGMQVAGINEAFDNKLTTVGQTVVENDSDSDSDSGSGSGSGSGSDSDSDWRSRLAKWLSRFKQSEYK
jgi:hypothetical protein